MQKCSRWDCGGNFCLQIKQPSQKVLSYHCHNFPAGWVEPQALFALPCPLLHTRSSTVQDFSIFLQPISDQTLDPSCCCFYFTWNPGRQSCHCKVADAQLLQACQSPSFLTSPSNRQSFSYGCVNRKASGLVQS